MSEAGSRFASFPIATALREALREGYGRQQLIADILAGIVVGIIALPLAMALAIGAGVPPQHGLYTAIVAGFLIALFGGSRGSVSGPTAAFIVILNPITAQYGIAGLLLATVMAGIILIVMGVARLGRLIEYIPHPVTTGFTLGIAVVIALLQVDGFLGLELEGNPANFFERMRMLAAALPTANWGDILVGGVALAIMILWPRLKTPVPAHLVAVTVAALLAYFGVKLVPDFAVATIGSQFSYVTADGQVMPGIPSTPPTLSWPWSWPGPDGEPFVLSFETLRSLIGPAFAIAMLGAIESLLCAVVVDNFLRTRHNPNAELIGQGIGNVVAPFFGGITATAAIARSAAGVRAGARSPVSAIVHALVVLLAVVSLAQLLAYVPMSALAALLLMTAWNMSDLQHVRNVLRIGPNSDRVVLLTCFALTVIFDMVVAVGVGTVLAALLFMHRVGEVSGGRWMPEAQMPELKGKLPADTRLYMLEGPLFFGAAEKAMTTLKRYEPDVRTLILWMGNVPIIDATGLIALSSALEHMRERGIFVVFAGTRPTTRRLLRGAGIRTSEGIVFVPTLERAVAFAQRRSARLQQAAASEAEAPVAT
ncbi:MAG: C4-dicarboxylic acid transporter DauA [Xanthomonadaceae bacterium]|nr:C4-dicarboxylic acid transporter DauA [Xanthomonadaceae bacterium]